MVRARAANFLPGWRPFLALLLAAGLLLPVCALAQDATPPAPDVLLKLPRDLSPWGMFMAADIVVKAVMVGLAFASRSDLDNLVRKSDRTRARTRTHALGHRKTRSRAILERRHRRYQRPRRQRRALIEAADASCACRPMVYPPPA